MQVTLPRTPSPLQAAEPVQGRALGEGSGQLPGLPAVPGADRAVGAAGCLPCTPAAAQSPLRCYRSLCNEEFGCISLSGRKALLAVGWCQGNDSGFGLNMKSCWRTETLPRNNSSLCVAFGLCFNFKLG